MYNLEYEDLENKIKKHTHKIKFIYALSFLFIFTFLVLLIINQFLKNDVINILILSFFGASVLLYLTAYIIGFTLQKWFYKEIKKCLERRNITANYSYYNKFVTDNLLKDCNLFCPTYDWKGRFINAIYGVYIDLKFSLCSMSINNDDIKLFNGDFIRVEQKFDFDFIIRRSNRDFGPSDFIKQNTLYEDFNNKFEIFASDTDKFQNFLSFDFLKSILSIENLILLSVSNGYVYIGLEYNYDPTSTKELLCHINDDYYDEFFIVVKLLEEFNK